MSSKPAKLVLCIGFIAGIVLHRMLSDKGMCKMIQNNFVVKKTVVGLYLDFKIT